MLHFLCGLLAVPRPPGGGAGSVGGSALLPDSSSASVKAAAPSPGDASGLAAAAIGSPVPVAAVGAKVLVQAMARTDDFQRRAPATPASANELVHPSDAFTRSLDKGVTLETPLEAEESPLLTCVMLSHQDERIGHALDVIERYVEAPDVFSEIMLIWNNPASRPFANDRDPHAKRFAAIRRQAYDRYMTVTLFESKVNSMNNRFRVWPFVRTRGVFIQDDDMWLGVKDLRCLHATWLQNPERLVGAKQERTDFEYPEATPMSAAWTSSQAGGNFARYHELSPSNCHLQSCASDAECDVTTTCSYPAGEFYSMLLPHPWLTTREHMRSYVAQQPLTWLVDEMTNCDDIAFNAVVANATREAPIAVDVSVYRHPSWNVTGTAMWMSDPSWAWHRSVCMARVQQHYQPWGVGRSSERDADASARDAQSRVGTLQSDGHPLSPPSVDSHSVWRRSSQFAQCPGRGASASE